MQIDQRRELQAKDERRFLVYGYFESQYVARLIMLPDLFALSYKAPELTRHADASD